MDVSEGAGTAEPTVQRTGGIRPSGLLAAPARQPKQFENFAHVEPRITRQTTIMRQPIPLVTKLQVTLYYVASGISRPGLGSCCLTSPHCHAAPHVLLLQQVALKFYVLHVALSLFQRQSSCTLIAIYR